MTTKEVLEGRLADLEERLETPEGHDRLADLGKRLTTIEDNQYELCKGLLGYLRADMATPWLASASALEVVLLDLLNQDAPSRQD